MPFSHFSSATTDALYRVYDAAWLELETAANPAVSSQRQAATKAKLTFQLLAAADRGERDFERLKTATLEGLR